MIRSLLLSLTLGALLHGQEITQYGPWIGYWQQARLSAYSPQDKLDQAYRESKGERWKWITADGRTDVRTHVYGLAAPSGIAFGTRIFIPNGLGYLDAKRNDPYRRVFAVDDRGSIVERGGEARDRLCLDLRYRTEASALAFGIKDAWVFIITGDIKAQEAQQ